MTPRTHTRQTPHHVIEILGSRNDLTPRNLGITFDTSVAEVALGGIVLI